MNYPKHWKAYLNHLEKLRQKYKLMMDLKELEVRQEWNEKSFKEQLIDRFHFLPTVPDSIAFRRALMKLDQKNCHDIQPKLETYWTWLVQRKDKVKTSQEEDEKEIRELIIGKELKWMKRKQKQ